MKEIEFNPTKHTLATSADVFRIYRELWGFAPIERISNDDNHNSGSGNNSNQASPQQGARMIERCDEGKRLVASYAENYNKVVKEGGDWMAAFMDSRVIDHVKICPQCQAYKEGRIRSDAEVQNDEDYNDLKRTQEEARM